MPSAVCGPDCYLGESISQILERERKKGWTEMEREGGERDRVKDFISQILMSSHHTI